MILDIYFNMILNMVWYFIPLLIFITLINSAWFKGVLGEWQVNLLIKFFLDKNQYHLCKNVTLPTQDGSTQIDHIIVSRFGVFVVETKNMKGWLFGSVNQKQWTQKIFKHSSKFQNPLHQNFKHVKTLEACLEIDKCAIFSVIIFVGDSTFKTKMPDNVTFARGGIDYIKRKTETLLSSEEVADVIAQIEKGRLTRGFKTNYQHIKHVKKIVREKEKTKSCSKCGANMVLRKATKGKNAGNEFWGCSAFPKCRNVAY
ncbi:MAG: NERD domain-containing protein [Colwellia sp.]|nr:NERD domain-containing protein [Colwellia sp.]